MLALQNHESLGETTNLQGIKQHQKVAQALSHSSSSQTELLNFAHWMGYVLLCALFVSWPKLRQA
jgi:hypothetical protein